MLEPLLHPDMQPWIDDIERYEQAAWQLYDQLVKGEVDLHTATRRLMDMHYKAHDLICLLRNSPPVNKHARRHLWTVSMIRQRVTAMRRAEFEATRRDRPPERSEA